MLSALIWIIHLCVHFWRWCWWDSDVDAGFVYS